MFVASTSTNSMLKFIEIRIFGIFNVSRFPFLLIIPPFSRISFQKKLPQPRLCFFRWIPDVLFKVNTIRSLDGTAWSPGVFFFNLDCKTCYINRYLKHIYIYMFMTFYYNKIHIRSIFIYIILQTTGALSAMAEDVAVLSLGQRLRHRSAGLDLWDSTWRNIVFRQRRNL